MGVGFKIKDYGKMAYVPKERINGFYNYRYGKGRKHLFDGIKHRLFYLGIKQVEIDFTNVPQAEIENAFNWFMFCAVEELMASDIISRFIFVGLGTPEWDRYQKWSETVKEETKFFKWS